MSDVLLILIEKGECRKIWGVVLLIIVSESVEEGLGDGKIGGSGRKEAERPRQSRKGRRQPRGHSNSNPTGEGDWGVNSVVGCSCVW